MTDQHTRSKTYSGRKSKSRRRTIVESESESSSKSNSQQSGRSSSKASSHRSLSPRVSDPSSNDDANIDVDLETTEDGKERITSMIGTTTNQSRLARETDRSGNRNISTTPDEGGTFGGMSTYLYGKDPHNASAINRSVYAFYREPRTDTISGSSTKSNGKKSIVCRLEAPLTVQTHQIVELHKNEKEILIYSCTLIFPSRFSNEQRRRMHDKLNLIDPLVDNLPLCKEKGSREEKTDLTVRVLEDCVEIIRHTLVKHNNGEIASTNEGKRTQKRVCEGKLVHPQKNIETNGELAIISSLKTSSINSSVTNEEKLILCFDKPENRTGECNTLMHFVQAKNSTFDGAKFAESVRMWDSRIEINRKVVIADVNAIGAENMVQYAEERVYEEDPHGSEQCRPTEINRRKVTELREQQETEKENGVAKNAFRTSSTPSPAGVANTTANKAHQVEVTSISKSDSSRKRRKSSSRKAAQRQKSNSQLLSTDDLSHSFIERNENSVYETVCPTARVDGGSPPSRSSPTVLTARSPLRTDCRINYLNQAKNAFASASCITSRSHRSADSARLSSSRTVTSRSPAAKRKNAVHEKQPPQLPVSPLATAVPRSPVGMKSIQKEQAVNVSRRFRSVSLRMPRSHTDPPTSRTARSNSIDERTSAMRTGISPIRQQLLITIPGADPQQNEHHSTIQAPADPPPPNTAPSEIRTAMSPIRKETMVVGTPEAEHRPTARPRTSQTFESTMDSERTARENSPAPRLLGAQSPSTAPVVAPHNIGCLDLCEISAAQALGGVYAPPVPGVAHSTPVAGDGPPLPSSSFSPIINGPAQDAAHHVLPSRASRLGYLPLQMLRTARSMSPIRRLMEFVQTAREHSPVRRAWEALKMAGSEVPLAPINQPQSAPDSAVIMDSTQSMTYRSALDGSGAPLPPVPQPRSSRLIRQAVKSRSKSLPAAIDTHGGEGQIQVNIRSSTKKVGTSPEDEGKIPESGPVQIFTDNTLEAEDRDKVLTKNLVLMAKVNNELWNLKADFHFKAKRLDLIKFEPLRVKMDERTLWQTSENWNLISDNENTEPRTIAISASDYNQPQTGGEKATNSENPPVPSASTPTSPLDQHTTEHK